MKQTNLEEVRDFVIANLNEDGTFNMRYSDISNQLDLTQIQVRNAMIHITKEGMLESVIPPTKGRNSSPKWRIRSKNTNHLIESHDSLIIEFEGYPLQIIQSEIGYVISKEAVAVASLTDVSILDKIMKANQAQFEIGDTTIIIDDELYMNKHSILQFLLKLNLSNCLKIKVDTLKKLQDMVVNKMVDSILHGKVVFTDDNHIEIRNNLAMLMDVDKDMVQTVFSELEEQIESIVNGISAKVTTQQYRIHKLEEDVKKCNGKIEFEKNSKNILITENRELKSRVLDK